ncbi:MAG: cytochrome c-type biogenesis protein CcmH [Rhizobiaceae bacterium]|nr:cytochrome c-type biogenesis protein CcmH [Rhizobiaceae bacterium]
MRLCRFLSVVLVLLAMALPSLAVQPDEVLKDPVLEARARSLSAGLRCMVCQNQSIDDSNADLARDLRILVRERLQAGDTDAEVLDYVVARYGEFVLLRPRFSWGNALLWLTPAILLLAGIGYAFSRSRAHNRQRAQELSDDEQARLRQILQETEH